MQRLAGRSAERANGLQLLEQRSLKPRLLLPQSLTSPGVASGPLAAASAELQVFSDRAEAAKGSCTAGGVPVGARRDAGVAACLLGSSAEEKHSRVDPGKVGSACEGATPANPGEISPLPNSASPLWSPRYGFVLVNHGESEENPSSLLNVFPVAAPPLQIPQTSVTSVTSEEPPLV